MLSGVQLVQGRSSAHCVLAVHVAPGASKAHVPSLQLSPPQQSVSLEQVAPSALQHTPLAQELPLQQSVAAAHVDPAAEHV